MFNFGTNDNTGGWHCTLVIILLLFIFFCGCGNGNCKQFSFSINPCSLAPILALAFCCGGIGIGKSC